MQRFAHLLFVCLLLACPAFAQQSASDSPASREEVLKYLDLVHMRELMKLRVEGSRMQLHQIIHDFVQKQPSCPEGFEVRMLKMSDNLLQDYPVDDLLDAMVPVYQKHLTKAEVSALIAFYSGPTGQAIVGKLPVITTESAQATTPIMQQILTKAVQRVQQALEEESRQEQAKPQKQTQQN